MVLLDDIRCFIKRHGLFHREGTDGGPTNVLATSACFELEPQIPCQCSDIKPFATCDLDAGDGPLIFEKMHRTDMDFTGLEFRDLSLARRITCAAAIHLDGAEDRRLLHDGASE